MHEEIEQLEEYIGSYGSKSAPCYIYVITGLVQG